MKLTIATLNEDIYEIFKKMFDDEPDVNIYLGSAFNISADALVSPANSFGYMDGGFDAQIVDNLGSSIETQVRYEIEACYFGEINIGEAFRLFIDKRSYKYLIVAPTMRVPMDVHLTTNAYVAFRAMLREAFICIHIKSIVTPTFCTGIGKMDPYVAATQMKMAYRNIIKGQRYKTFEMAHISQIKMLSPDFTN